MLSTHYNSGKLNVAMQLTLPLSSPFLEDLEGFGSYSRQPDISSGVNNMSSRSSANEKPSRLGIAITFLSLMICQSGTALAVPNWLLLLLP